MTATKHIPISRVCSKDESELEELLFGQTLLQVYYTDKDESKGIHRCRRIEIHPENINTEKQAKNEVDCEGPSVTYEELIGYNIL